MAGSARPNYWPDFWDIRCERAEHLFGASPNMFGAHEAHRLSSSGEKLFDVVPLTFWLEEGPILNGKAAVVQTVVRRAL